MSNVQLIQGDILTVNLSGVCPNLIITSPPYNCDISYHNHKDKMSYGDYLEFSERWMEIMYNILPDDGRICINIPISATMNHLGKLDDGEYINYPVLSDFIQISKKLKFKYWRSVIWNKNISNKTCWGSWCSASSPFMVDPSESILILYKKQWKRLSVGASTIEGPEFMKYTKNVWEFQPETNSSHPAPFPVELPQICIKLLSYKEDTVMDCFMGHGTTGVSAVNLGRNFVGVEKSPEYFQYAKQRIRNEEIKSEYF